MEILVAARGVSRFHRRVSKSQKFLRYWLPPLAWMGMIFSVSSDSHSSQHSSRIFEPIIRWLFPHISPEHMDFAHFLCRKVCHLSEYAILAWLLWRAVRQPRQGDTRPWRWDQAGLALSFVLLYAASDEFHQAFVPTRTAHFTDVLIDVSGGSIGLLLLWGVGKIRKRW
jgi:VanZ family protein